MDPAERFEHVSAEVFGPLQRYLLRRAPRQDADDVMSDVLLTVWRRIDDAPMDRPLPWCYGIARRSLANHRRSERRHLRLVERIASEPPFTQGDPADALTDPELTQALDALAETDREVLKLWAWEQLEPREIATVLGVTPNAATLRLGRAKVKLARSLERQNLDLVGHRGVEDTEEHPDD